jgi:5-methyltetrahydropteroyltriglutamate--homocysteine methyltransferase
MMDWSFLEHYDDRRAACLALARELRRELDVLVAAGAAIVQIDEPALSARPDELGLAAEALDVLTSGLPAYFVLHVCYGAFDSIFPGLLQLPVDNFDFAVSHSSTDLLQMFERDPFTKDMSVGVIDVHSHDTTPRSEVAARIRRAARFLAPERLWIGPDCGLKTRTVEEAEAKLEHMAAATHEVRAELAGGAAKETR